MSTASVIRKRTRSIRSVIWKLRRRPTNKKNRRLPKLREKITLEKKRKATIDGA